MLISHRWLKEYIPRTPSPDAITEKLSLHSVEVEGVQREKNGDAIIEIDNKTMTHRADLFSHTGIAREIAAVFDVPFHYPRMLLLPKKLPKFSVVINDRAACPRYIGIAMDVVIGSTPDFIKERLQAVGVKTINNVVDITNYVMLELGEPLHAFDAGRVSGNRIIVRRARAGETLATLDHETKKLDETILVIADAEKPLAIAGVIGGEQSGINGATTKIILEAANFDALTVRKASQTLGVRTESALRWEKGIMPEVASRGAARAVELLQKYVHGRVTALIDVYPKRQRETAVELSQAFLTRLSGLKIPAKTVAKHLRALEFDMKTTRDGWRVTPPWFRSDVHIPEDVVEEIVRLYGVATLPEQELSGVLNIPKSEEEFIFSLQLHDILTRLGCTETELHSFVGSELIAAIGESENNYVAIANPLSDDLRYVRRSLLPRMLENVARNSRYRDNLKLFEIGHVYSATGEERRGAILVMHNDSYRYARGIMETLLQELHISFTSNIVEDNHFADSKALQLRHGKTVLATLGIIHPQIAQHFGLQHIAFAEFSVAALFAYAVREFSLTPLSSYPPLPLDLSLIIPEETPWQQIEDVVWHEGKNDLRECSLREVYRGKGIPQGHKSFSMHIVFQSETRTLAMGDIEKWRDKLMQKLHTRFDASLRGAAVDKT